MRMGPADPQREPGAGRKPGAGRAVMFAGMLAASTMTESCAFLSNILPKKTGSAPKIEQKFVPRQKDKDCNPDLTFILNIDERAIETACKYGREYALTNRDLIIITKDKSSDEYGPRFSLNRINMADYLARGLVDYKIGDGSIYVLTRDSKISRIDHNEVTSNAVTMDVPFETNALTRSHLALLDRYALVAPMKGAPYIFTFEKKARPKKLDVPRIDGAAFFERDGKLFYGKEGVAELEITISGGSAEGVRAVPR